MGLRNYLVRHLLHYANADPGVMSGDRDAFYELKERLLCRHARFRGYVYQEIVKKCWGDWDGQCGRLCSRCGGSGIYQQRWVQHQHWQWGQYEFMVPVEVLRARPSKVHIKGHVQRPDYGRASDEAALWLLLLCGEREAFWRRLRGSCGHGWTFWPLLNVQKAVFRWCVWRENRKARKFLDSIRRKSDQDAEVPF